jgi:hypothetical protein
VSGVCFQDPHRSRKLSAYTHLIFRSEPQRDVRDRVTQPIEIEAGARARLTEAMTKPALAQTTQNQKPAEDSAASPTRRDQTTVRGPL